jgi:HEAT repeat protein
LRAVKANELAQLFEARAAKDARPHVRAYALEALGNLESSSTKSFFVKRATKDKSALARAAAIDALARYADPTLRELFEQAITDARPRSPVIAAAGRALEALPPAP